MIKVQIWCGLLLRRRYKMSVETNENGFSKQLLQYIDEEKGKVLYYLNIKKLSTIVESFFIVMITYSLIA